MARKLKVLMICISILFSLCIVLLLICRNNAFFCEWCCRYISSPIRQISAYFTSILPFSLAEILVISIIPLVLVLLIYLIISILKKKFKIFCCSAAMFVMILSSVYILNFGLNYYRKPIEENLNVERVAPNAKEIISTCNILINEIEKLLPEIDFKENGASKNPHSFSETDKLVNYGYTALRKNYNFFSDINVKSKKILLSKIMTYTHISGMYMPFTSEANINTNYPDYVVAYTIAHEKAHQRGIAGEDEANFMAFLSCMSSCDPYLEYSALMSMLDYYLSALYKTSEQDYVRVIESCDKKIIGEMYSYYNFFEKYSDSKASQIASDVNDVYLKAQGQNSGVQSYGLVIELMQGFIEKTKEVR